MPIIAVVFFIIMKKKLSEAVSFLREALIIGRQENVDDPSIKLLCRKKNSKYKLFGF